MEARSFRLALVLLVCLAPGCAGSRGSLAAVPRAWRKTNPWGPEAQEASARGEWKPLFYTPQMGDWAAFARESLQDGDLLFRYGRSTQLRDSINNRVMTGISDSRFTHDGLAFHENGRVWVYDAETEPQRVRKIPFEF